MAQKSLYVGNLPYSFNEANLIDLFSKYGATTARIIQGRGFGFVDVDEQQSQEAIAEQNDSVIDGRRIVVNEARPRDDRGGGGSSRASFRPSKPANRRR